MNMPPSKTSAGLLMYRQHRHTLQYFLVHPGGPFFVKKNEGVWTIPKGLVGDGEELLAAAQREFNEETGFTPTEPFVSLGHVQQKSGKTVHVWAFEGDFDPGQLVSNTCEILWPPRSGQRLIIPEVDRGNWFNEEEARPLICAEQQVLFQRLASVL